MMTSHNKVRSPSLSVTSVGHRSLIPFNDCVFQIHTRGKTVMYGTYIVVTRQLDTGQLGTGQLGTGQLGTRTFRHWTTGHPDN